MKPLAKTSYDINDITFILICIFSITHTLIDGAFCPTGCRCVDKPPTISADCRGANLTVFPILLNPRTRSLALSQNRLSTISHDELSTYPDLEYLDLAENRLLEIERGAFFRLQRLKVLRLNGNQLTSLLIETFTGLSELKALDLSQNGLQRLATSIFSDLPNLESLNLSNNAISSISPGALTNLRQLKELHLQHNDLRNVPKIALRSCDDSLRVLDMSHNRIESIEDESFNSLLGLEDLNLAHNHIERVEDDSFANLRNLQRLNLNTNRIFRMPTMSFRHLTELQTLTMDENFLSELPTSGFEGLTRLKTLSVSRCPHLTRTCLNAFSGLYELETLILSENAQFSEFHPSSFEQQRYHRRKNWRNDDHPVLEQQDQLKYEQNSGIDDPTIARASAETTVSSSSSLNLKRVYLFDNNLRSLPRNLLPYDQLEELDLRHNPWQCDCQMKFISSVLRRIYGSEDQKFKSINDIPPDTYDSNELPSTNTASAATLAHCHSPQALVGRTLISLNDFDNRDNIDPDENGFDGFDDCQSSSLYSDSSWIISVLIVTCTLTLLTATLALTLRYRKIFTEMTSSILFCMSSGHSDSASDGQASSKSFLSSSGTYNSSGKRKSRSPPQKNFYQKQHYIIAEPYVDTIGHQGGTLISGYHPYDSTKGHAELGSTLTFFNTIGSRYNDFAYSGYETPHAYSGHKEDTVGDDIRPFLPTSNYINYSNANSNTIGSRSCYLASTPNNNFCYSTPSPNSNNNSKSYNGSNSNGSTQCSTLDRVGSFRVIQTYPIPITEV